MSRLATSLLLALLVCLSIGACKRTVEAVRPDPPPPASATAKKKRPKPAPPIGDGLAIFIDGEPLALPFGRATIFADTLELVLTNEEIDCDDNEPDVALRFEVGAGPDGTFFAGQEIGRPMYLWSNGEPYVSERTRRGRLTLDPVTTRLGDHVRGALHFENVTALKRDKPKATVVELSAKGRFDVVMCNDGLDHQGVVLPPIAANAPLQLEVGGKPIELSTALAITTADLEGIYYTLAFYVHPTTCAAIFTTVTNDDRLVVYGIGRSGQDELLTGVRQPATASFESSTLEVDSYGANAWVELTEITPTTLKGRLVARENDPGSAKLEARGEFEATICGPW